jgi:hypothetical protein
MAEIIQVFTVVRRIFPSDAIPWQVISLPTNLQRLKERYKFADSTQGPQVGESAPLIFGNGEFNESGLLRPIQQLVLEPTVIQHQTNTDDKGAAAFYASLLDWFSEIKGTQVMLVEKKRAFQTIIVAKLDVEFDQMISEEMKQFIQAQVLPAVSQPDADVRIELQSLSWKVSYEATGREYIYLPKAFTLEPRVGSNFGDRVYYTISPTSYATHLKLLTDFERILGDRKKQEGTSADQRSQRAK